MTGVFVKKKKKERKKEICTQTGTEGRPCEDTGGRCQAIHKSNTQASEKPRPAKIMISDFQPPEL